jgi:MoxR-like ATPase
LHSDEIVAFQELVRRVPVVDNVVDYAVKLVHKTLPNTDMAASAASQYLEWGAGPRASQHLIVGAKCNALLNGKYSPDIEDVQAVALPILRHRIVRNFKAEAEGITTEKIIQGLL